MTLTRESQLTGSIQESSTGNKH